MKLSPCVSCRRHVFDDQTSCPFCGADHEASTPSQRKVVHPRMVAAAIAMSLGAAGCPGAIAVYGPGPTPLDAGHDASASPAVTATPIARPEAAATPEPDTAR